MREDRDAGGAVGRQDVDVLHEDQALGRIARLVPADEGVAPAEHEREAPSPVQKAADAGVEHAFDQHVDGFAISTEARLEHREARLHAEHEERAEQHPAGVDRVDDVAGGRGLVRIGGAAGAGGVAKPARAPEREPVGLIQSHAERTRRTDVISPNSTTMPSALPASSSIP